MNAANETKMSKSEAKIVASRFHDFSCGHRVVGHEGKCQHLHGHNYRVHFHCEAAKLDDVGRVIDFGAIKILLCDWLERVWDHKMLIWEMDPMLSVLETLDPQGIVVVSFNPTAENMAEYLLSKIGPVILNTAKVEGLELIQVTVEETRKCSATAYTR